MRIIIRLVEGAPVRQAPVPQRERDAALRAGELRRGGEVAAEEVSSTECGEERAEGLEAELEVFEVDEAGCEEAFGVEGGVGEGWGEE